MSYRPSQPIRPGTSQTASPGRVRAARRSGIPWLAGCALGFFGFVLGMLAIVVAALLYFGTPPSSTPLPRPATVDRPDVNATITEQFLNAQVQRELKNNNVTLAGGLTLKDIVLKVLPNQQIDVQARLGTPVADIDVSVTEALGLQGDGTVVVRAIGQPRVGQGNLPISSENILEAVNRDLIQPQINRVIANFKAGDRPLKLVGLTSQSGLLNAQFNAQ